jgi:hypothetical protein
MHFKCGSEPARDDGKTDGAALNWRTKIHTPSGEHPRYDTFLRFTTAI